MDTPEQLRDRLFHLAWLGEELPEVATRPGGGWIYRQIAREAAAVLAVATEYVTEYETARVYLNAQGTITLAIPDTGVDAVRAAWADVEQETAGRTLPVPTRTGGGVL